MNEMIKSRIVLLLLSAVAVAPVHGAATFDFDNPSAGLSRTYTFTNLAANPPTVTAGTLAGSLTDAANMGSESFKVAITAVTVWSNAAALASGNLNTYLASRTAVNWSGTAAGIGPAVGTAGAFDTPGEALLFTFDLSGLSPAHRANFKLTGFTLAGDSTANLWDWAVINTASNVFTDFSSGQNSDASQNALTTASPPRIGNGDKFILAVDNAGGGNPKAATISFDIFKGSQWQLVTPTYPTEDTLVAAVVMDASRLPADPTNQDCSAAFSAALQEAASMGGGQVYVPAGQYLFTNRLEFPRNVVLRGDCGSVAGADKTVRGTILKVTYNGTNAFIRLNDRAGLQNLSFWYPNQSLTSVVPYSATIDGSYDTSGNPSTTDEIYIKNINLVNAYVGFAPQCNAVRVQVFGIYGSPLNLAVYQKDSSSVPLYTELNFSADYWAGSGLPGAPAKAVLQNYLRTNATGIKVGSSDNIFGVEWHVADYNRGFHFLNEGAGTINGNLYGLTSANCVTGLVAESTGLTFLINSSFQGSTAAVTMNTLASQGLLFNGCAFNSGSDYDIDCQWNGNLPKGLRFQHCTFQKKIFANSTDLSVVDCAFTCNGPTISLTNKTGSAIVAGNTFAYAGNPIQLNGASTNIVAFDTNSTCSKTYTPFDIHGYNSIRKPAATNLIVMGTAGHPVALDGTTDAAPAIQSALNSVAALGGGIIFLPQGSYNGYAIRTPLTVPAGVELCSSAVGKHSFHGNRGEPMAGALLQIYHGRDGSTPAITLNAGSGLKGLTIHYPEQFSANIAPYSFAVRAVDGGAYVQNLQFINAYDCVEFNSSTNHLAENMIATHIHNSVRAVNCANGRIQNMHVRDEWGDSGLSTFNAGDAWFGFSISNALPYVVTGCTNEEIFATFSRVSRWVGAFTNSTLHTLNFSAESCHNSVQVRGIPAGGSVELIGSSLRANTDTGQTLTMIDVANAPGDGDLRLFSSLLNGYPDTILRAADANCTLQQCYIQLEGQKVAANGISLEGVNPGVVRLENSPITASYAAISIADADNKRLELVGNFADSGLGYFPFQSRMQATVNPANLSTSTRLAEVANLAQPAVSAQMNLPAPGASGLSLLSASYTLQQRYYSFNDWYSTAEGYAPTGSPTQLLFQVTNALFNSGQEPASATINFFYYNWQAGQIVVSYKLPGGNWINAGTNALSGDGGYVFPPVKNTTSPYWLSASVNVPGSLFKVGTQIKLALTGNAIFAYLNLTSSGAMLQPPFGGVLNHAPAFSQDPFSLASAATGTPCDTPFSSLATDPDPTNTLTFSKLSGPAWLAVTPDGRAQGTPGIGDAGTNSFVVRATDDGGMYDEAVMSIYVVSTNPPTVGMVLSGTNLMFSWPAATHNGWVLETKTNLLDPTWTDFPASRTSPGYFIVPITPAQRTGFYRLRYP